MVEMRGLLEETVELLERTLPARYCDKAMALFAQLAEERNLKFSQRLTGAFLAVVN